MRSRADRSFGEQGDRLVAFERLSNLQRLVPGALDMTPADVDRVVLVGEPVDEAGAEIVLGHERRAGRSGDGKDVEPADMVGDEQAVRADRRAFDPNARTHQPRRRT